jgi:hypothetical protein
MGDQPGVAYDDCNEFKESLAGAPKSGLAAESFVCFQSLATNSNPRSQAGFGLLRRHSDTAAIDHSGSSPVRGENADACRSI